MKNKVRQLGKNDYFVNDGGKLYTGRFYSNLTDTAVIIEYDGDLWQLDTRQLVKMEPTAGIIMKENLSPVTL